MFFAVLLYLLSGCVMLTLYIGYNKHAGTWWDPDFKYSKMVCGRHIPVIILMVPAWPLVISGICMYILLTQGSTVVEEHLNNRGKEEE